MLTSVKVKSFFAQVGALTSANLTSRYRRTFSGFLWVLLNPIMIFGAQSFAFHVILNIQMENYPLFLLSGILPWIFLTQSMDMGTPILVNSGRLLKSMPIHPLACLLAQIVDNMINFVAAFFVILLPLVIFQNFHFKNLILIPIPILIITIATVGLTWLLATVNVFFRDTKFIVSFFVTVTFYLTPIFYPEKFLPEQYRWLVKFNLFYYLIAPFREIVKDPFTIEFVHRCRDGMIVASALFFLAVLIWRTKRNAVFFHI